MLHRKDIPFPWMCSLKEAGFRGKHKCGVTLLAGGLQIEYRDYQESFLQESQTRQYMKMKPFMRSTRMTRRSSCPLPIVTSCAKTSQTLKGPLI